MRWCLALLICCLAVVNALSSSGSRLLAILEDTEQKDLYSTLWADLEGNLLFLSPWIIR
jgi:oligosaccharyltransferase complex subunit beta